MRTPFINPQEMLLVAARFDSGTEWIGHPAENFDTADEVADTYGNDENVEFWRVDLTTKTIEDVTEDVAKAYLRLAENGEKTPEDEDVIPIFVACSEAWAEFCETYEEPEDFSPATMKGSNGSIHAHNGSVVG